MYSYLKDFLVLMKLLSPSQFYAPKPESFASVENSSLVTTEPPNLGQTTFSLRIHVSDFLFDLTLHVNTTTRCVNV